MIELESTSQVFNQDRIQIMNKSPKEKQTRNKNKRKTVISFFDNEENVSSGLLVFIDLVLFLIFAVYKCVSNRLRKVIINL